MSVTVSEQMQGWQRDEIVRLLEERNVSFRAAARIMQLLDEQPMPPNYYGNQTDVAKELRKWTDE